MTPASVALSLCALSILAPASAFPQANEEALGQSLLAAHHEPEAMDRFESVLSTDPRNPQARQGEFTAATNLAVNARAAGHPEIALEILQHARIRLSDDPRLLLELGIQASELHLLSLAADALTTAHKLKPHDLDVLYALGRVEVDQQNMSAAETDFRTYLAARPQDATAHFGLGHILVMVQRPQEARLEFERSIELQPVQTESYYQLGQIALDARQDTQAVPLFRKTLARDPKHGGALTGMGILALRAHDDAQAEHYLSDAIKASPDYGTAHYYRSLALSHMGKKQEAAAELQIATALGKTSNFQ